MFVCIYIRLYFCIYILSYIYIIVTSCIYMSFNSTPIQNGRRDKALSPKCFYYHGCFGNGICQNLGI